MKKTHLIQSALCFFIIASSIFFTAKAQPSGGPYGPVRQTYELPKNAKTIYYVATDGDKTLLGTSIEKPTTIETAIEKAKAGDAIIVRGGTYRTGNLILNQGITIQPYANEQPVFKGTYVATEWKNLRNGMWMTKWNHFFPAKPDDWWNRSSYARQTPMHRFNNDMVFINGKFLQSVGLEQDVNENTFFIDYDAGLVYIGIDPTNKLVEITAFNVALHRITGECHGSVSDKKGFVLKGIDFTQYAYRAIEIDGVEPEKKMTEAEIGKDVVGTDIENCSITFCSRVAAYFRGDKLILKNCKISDTSTEGIYIIASSDVWLEKNIFARNNIEKIGGYYPATVKIFNQTHRVTCYDNLITDMPESNGIWYDVGNCDGRFINNWVENVGNGSYKFDKTKTWPSQNGFFFEISKGVICAGNVFTNCDQGIFILNSSGAKVHNNTFVNSTVVFGRNGRNPANDGLFGWHSSTGSDVDKRTNHVFSNNLLYDDENHLRPLLFVWQPDTFYLRKYKPQFDKLENNVFVRSLSNSIAPTIYWTQALNNESPMSFMKPDSLQNIYPEFSGSNRLYTGVPVFKSPELKNFLTLKTFPGQKDGGLVPANVMGLMNLPKKDNKFVGAYPPVN